MSINNRGAESRSSASSAVCLNAYCLCLLLLVIFAFYPRLSTGFVTQDDSNIALIAKSWKTLLPFSWDFARTQGRFFGVFLIIELAVPYLIESRLYYYSITIAALLCNIVLFYALMKMIFRSREIAIFVTALSLAFLQNNWEHNPLTAYPFGYTTALSCFLVSFMAFLQWRRVSSAASAIIAGVSYFLALLTTEAFATYILLFLIIGVAAPVDSLGLRRRAWFTIKILAPVAIPLLLYTLLRVTFSHFYPGQYEGVQVAKVDFSKVAAVIWQYGTSTLPGYFYFNDSAWIGLRYDGLVSQASRLQLLTHTIRVESVAKSVVLLWLSVSMIGTEAGNISKSQVRLLPLGLLAMFAPVTLVGFTAKYQRWVLQGHSVSYIHSYFAFFATVFVVALLVLLGKQLVTRRRVLLISYAIVVSLLLAILSLATDAYNDYIVRDQHLSDLKWRIVDEMAKTEEMKAIPSDSIIYAPSLWYHRGIVENLPQYWSRYLSWRTGKSLTVCQKSEDFNRSYRDHALPVYYMGFHQEPNEADEFAVLSEIPSSAAATGELTYSRRGILLTYSKNESFVLIGHCSSGSVPIIRIDGQSVASTAGDVFVQRLEHPTPQGELTKTIIDSNVPIDMSSLTLSFFPVVPDFGAVKLEYGNGFYTEERNITGNLVWSWASGDADMLVRNHSVVEVNTCIKLRVLAISVPRTVTVSTGQYQQSVALTSSVNASDVSIPLVLAPGRTVIHFVTDRPPQLAGNGDPRQMAFCVQNAALCEKK